MSLSEFTRKLVEVKLSRYCKNRIPEEARDNLRLIFKINEDIVTLFLTRPYFKKDRSQWAERPVAQIRFDDENKKWLLYFMDRNNRWHLYDLIQPIDDFDGLLRELDRAPTGIFWG